MTEKNYKALYEAALDAENKKMSYIDLMQPEALRAEMRALISLLEAERRTVQELQKRLDEITKALL